MSEREAFTTSLAQAEAGDPDAQFGVAQACQFGTGVTEDATLARAWLLKAAEAGHRRAQAQVAELLSAAGDPASLSQAIMWYQRAADQGDPGAMFALGRMHLEGSGVARDRQRAASLLLRSGRAEAHQLLAETSTEWLEDRAERGDADAQYQLAMRSWDAAGTDGERAIAVGFLDKAAVQGHARAQHRLAEILWAGHDAPRDRSRALDLYRAAAAQGFAEASAALIDLHLWNETPGVTVKEAARQMSKINRGCSAADALYRLGDRYRGGWDGVAPDPVKAARHIRQAAEEGSPRAQLKLAEMHLTGEGCALDPVQAERWLTLAAKSVAANYVERWTAKRELGLLYLKGVKGIPDPVKARHWLGPACDEKLAVAWLDSGTEAGMHLASEWMRVAVDEEWNRYRNYGRIFADACFKLGLRYCSGDVNSRDLVESVKWLSLARYFDADDSNPVSKQLDRIYALQLGRSPTAISELAFAVGNAFLDSLRAKDGPREELVTLWWREAAERGHAEAQFRLALFLLHEPGGGCAEAVTKVDLTRQAGFADAPSAPADGSGGGHGLAASVAEGVRWLRRAADQGHAGARQRLGNGAIEVVGQGLDVGHQPASLSWTSSSFGPRDAILSTPGGDGSCIPSASSAGAVSQRSHSPSLPRITGMALLWTGFTSVLAKMVRNVKSR